MTPLSVLLLALGALLPLPLALRGWRQRRTRRAWLELAPKLELSPTAGGVLSGRHQGHPVEVLLSPDGTAQLRMKARASLPAGMHLSRQEPGPHRLRLRGLQDIQVGEPALDDAFLIQGRNPAAVIRLVREPDVRDALLALQADLPRATLTGTEVVAPLGPPVQEESCRHALRTLARLTTALERAAGQHESLAAAAREQARRDALPVKAARPQAPTVEEPPNAVMDEIRRETEIRAEFMRRTGRYTLFGQLPFVVGALQMFLGNLLLRRESFLGLPSPVWPMLGMGLFCVGVAGSLFGRHKWLRCPACEQDLVDGAGLEQQSLLSQMTRLMRAEVRPGYRRGRVLDALSLPACPHCKARLR